MNSRRRPFSNMQFYKTGRCRIPNFCRFPGGGIGVISVAILDGKLVLWPQTLPLYPSSVNQHLNDCFNLIVPAERIIKIEVGKISQWTGWFWLSDFYSADAGHKTVEIQVPTAQNFINTIYTLRRESRPT